MKKTTLTMYKAMLPSLLIYLLITAGLMQIFQMMGLGTDSFMTVGAKPEFHFSGLAVVSVIVYLIYYLLVGLVGYGLILMIYRVARYDAEVEFVDAFYFFNAKAGTTLGTYILEKVLSGVLFLLLIIPGIVFSMAMVPLGAVVGIDQIHGADGAFHPIKDTWRVTKGHKGMIFGRMAIVIILIVVLSMGMGILIASVGLSSQWAKGIVHFIGTIVFGLISYYAVVDVVRELVDRGAFDVIDPIEETIDKSALEGGDAV